MEKIELKKNYSTVDEAIEEFVSFDEIQATTYAMSNIFEVKKKRKIIENITDTMNIILYFILFFVVPVILFGLLSIFLDETFGIIGGIILYYIIVIIIQKILKVFSSFEYLGDVLIKTKDELLIFNGITQKKGSDDIFIKDLYKIKNHEFRKNHEFEDSYSLSDYGPDLPDIFSVVEKVSGNTTDVEFYGIEFEADGHKITFNEMIDTTSLYFTLSNGIDSKSTDLKSFAEQYMVQPKTYYNADRTSHINMATNDLRSIFNSVAISENLDSKREWIRNVGQDLYDAHGFSAMQDVFINVQQEKLSSIWDGVGGWVHNE